MITQEAYRARHRVKLADNADAGRRRSANASECAFVPRSRNDGNHKLANPYTSLCPGYVDSLDDGSHDVEASGPPR